MSTSAQVPQDHPLMRAWNAYKATPEYANSKIWAQHAEHVDGSLWALFMAGWQAALDVDHQRGADDEDVCAEVREARAALAEGAQG